MRFFQIHIKIEMFFLVQDSKKFLLFQKLKNVLLSKFYLKTTTTTTSLKINNFFFFRFIYAFIFSNMDFH